MSQLLLDIDNKDHLAFTERFKRTYPVIMSYHGRFESIAAYETNKGYHVKITTEKDLAPVDIVFLQSVLGSDPLRELLNWNRYILGLPLDKFNVLFVKKYKGKVLQSEEKYDAEFSAALARVVLEEDITPR